MIEAEQAFRWDQETRRAFVLDARASSSAARCVGHPFASRGGLVEAEYTGAVSVATSVGRTFTVAIARRKNRRAAKTSRRAQTSRSMTWPCWSPARYTYRKSSLILTLSHR